MKLCNFCWEPSNHELEIYSNIDKKPVIKFVYFCDFHEPIMQLITVNDSFFDEIKEGHVAQH